MTTTEFEHIAQQLRPQMMRVALDFFPSEEDAEDAVQDVLLKMWKRDWKPDDDIKALAIRATKNQCVSMARKQRLRHVTPLEKDVHECISSVEADQAILTREQRMMIEIAISTLTHSEQRIIRLKQDKGLDAEQISIITGIKLASVRSMLSMARKKLIEKLKLSR